MAQPGVERKAALGMRDQYRSVDARALTGQTPAAVAASYSSALALLPRSLASTLLASALPVAMPARCRR